MNERQIEKFLTVTVVVLFLIGFGMLEGLAVLDYHHEVVVAGVGSITKHGFPYKLICDDVQHLAAVISVIPAVPHTVGPIPYSALRQIGEAEGWELHPCLRRL